MVNMGLQVCTLELSMRARNVLRCAKIQTLRELVEHSPRDLRRLRNFGEMSLLEVERLLAKMGLQLGFTPPSVDSRRRHRDVRKWQRIAMVG